MGDFFGILGLAVGLVAHFGLLWYKLGRLEAKLEEHCQQPNCKTEEGKHG